MPFLLDHINMFRVVHAAAAIHLKIGIDQLGIAAGMGNPNMITVAHHRGEVTDHYQEILRMPV